MRTTLLVCIIALSYGNLANGQAPFSNDYVPLVSRGTIPAPFLLNARIRTTQDVANRSVDNLSKRRSKEYYTLRNYFLSSTFLSGSVFYNDPMTIYVNRIADNLMKDQPDLRKKLNIYVTRYSLINATSFGDGTILINSGLIADMDNEAQLAFVLAHEISHFVKRHSLDQFKFDKQNAKVGFSNSKNNSNRLKGLSFSRSQEIEADKEAITMLSKTKYPLYQASLALSALQYSHPSNYTGAFNFDSFLPKTLEVKKPKKEDIEKGASASGVAEKVEVKEEEAVEEDKSDTFSTHPDLGKRIAFAQMAGKNKPDSLASPYVQPQSEWNRINSMAHLELLSHTTTRQLYPYAFYQAGQLLLQYPDNVYLNNRLVESLYWVALYYENDNVPKVPDEPDEEDSVYRDLYQVYKIMYSSSKDKLVQWATTLAQKNMAKFPLNDEAAIIHARIVELDKGLTTAKPLYKKFTSTFPKSKHSAFAKAKSK